MKKKRISMIALGAAAAVLAGALAGCSQSDKKGAEDTEKQSEVSGHASKCEVTLTEGKYSEEKLDASWDGAAAVQIYLEGSTIVCDDRKVKLEENKITITEAGTYVLSGELPDGQVVIDAEKEEYVKLVLDGADISCDDSAPIYSKSGNVIVTLAEGTENRVSDGREYRREAEEYNELEEDDEPGAVIFAKDDLTFNGTGTLTVTGNRRHAIQCKDDLKFVDGTYIISAADDGIVGKDSISVKNGQFTIEAEDKGMKVTNYEEADKGYILIEDGVFQITAGGDGIQAETLLRINGGEFQITAGGGSKEAADRMAEGDGGFGGRDMDRMPGEGDDFDGEMELPEPGKAPADAEVFGAAKEAGSDEDVSGGKALKSYVELTVAGGNLNLDASDDGVHSNQNVTVAGGTLVITSGNDGIHADKTLRIESGSIDVQKSYEGLEGFEITVNDGDVRVTAFDDGINAAGNVDSAEYPESKGFMNEEDQGAVMTFNGGAVYVNAQGDGLDANGDIFINGGSITVHGPVSGGDGTLDYASVCRITGGTFVGIGSAAMAQNPTKDSTQPVIAGVPGETIKEGTVISVKDKKGETLLSVTTEKAAQWFALSSPEFKTGESYTVCIGERETEVKLGETVNVIN